MSLGINSIWRVRPQVARPLSLIPGDFLSLSAHQTSVLDPRASAAAWSRFAATTSGERHNAPTAPTAATRDSSPAPPLPLSAGSAFLQRLAHVPVRRHGPRQSVLVEPPTAYAHNAETHRSMRKGRNAGARQLALERYRSAKGVPLPDWRLILWNLGRWTPDYSDRHAQVVVKVIIPPDSSNMLLLDGQSSLWDIKTRIKCSIKMYPGDGEEEDPYLLLSGQRQAVEAAIQDILKVSKCATVIHLPSLEVNHEANHETSHEAIHPLTPASTEDEGSPLVTAISPPLTQGQHNAVILHKDLALPAVWTSAALDAHVAALVNSQMVSGAASYLSPGSLSHRQAIIRQLHQTFKDPMTGEVVSCTAFKMALRYMAKSGVTHGPDTRALYARMDMLGLPMDTEVFNILAESAVVSNDLRFFGTVLHLMHRRGHVPNLATWVLFLRMIKAEEVKRYILHVMDRKSLLDAPGAVERVSLELIHADIERSIQQGKDLKTFLSDQDRLYGPKWLTRPSLHKIIEVLGRHGRLDDVLQVTDLMMSQASCYPTTLTLNIILTHCKIQNNLHGALRVLQKLEHRRDVASDGVTCHLLFEAAWRNKMPHTLGVLWRYACLTSSTSYRMRRRMGHLLCGHRSAAKFASHLNLLEDAGRAVMLLFPEYGVVHGLKEDGRSLNGSWPSSRALAEWYKSEYKSRKPANGLAPALKQALALDAQLHKDIKAGKSSTLTHIEILTVFRPEASRPEPRT